MIAKTSFYSKLPNSEGKWHSLIRDPQIEHEINKINKEKQFPPGRASFPVNDSNNNQTKRSRSDRVRKPEMQPKGGHKRPYLTFCITPALFGRVLYLRRQYLKHLLVFCWVPKLLSNATRVISLSLLGSL